MTVFLLCAGFALLCALLSFAFFRRVLTSFSLQISEILDDILKGKDIRSQNLRLYARDTLQDKVLFQLIRLHQITESQRDTVRQEKKELQELISDISHQVKTPLTNLRLLSGTIFSPGLSPEAQREFLTSFNDQLDKLDFLIHAMIKTSRLETGIISLHPENLPVADTLTSALGTILPSAEEKNISVTVDCSPDCRALHDVRWTGEALFNLLENSVKYTRRGGQILVTVREQEIYTRIDIQDTGKGIPEEEQGRIWQRFYREPQVRDTEGIGLGLFLTREIVTLQNGYVKVASQVGLGSCFSVFLPRKN